MNIYLLTQSLNNRSDTYDSAVVAAEDFNSAALIHPDRPNGWQDNERTRSDWALPQFVTVRLIGKAEPGISQGVICASFNAG